MRVLVACEFSGVVRDAFLAEGHDAMSCDLRETEKPGPHYVGDVRDILGNGWDMVIAHPPCDYLANCGVRWRVERGEFAQIKAGEEFFRLFIDCAPLWAIENPVMARKYTSLPKPTFTRQPWQFGDNVKKRVCWWTNLPPLVPTSDLDGSTARAEVHLEPPGPNRKKNRARFFPGMAKAMAKQWGAAAATATLFSLSPAQAATVAYDAQGPFLAVEADTYTGSKFDLIAPPATGGADPTVIIAIAVVLLACVFLCPDGDSDDPRTYASDGVIPPVSQVPLPAGAWLFLAALGALAARARR